jgi:ferredoxin
MPVIKVVDLNGSEQQVNVPVGGVLMEPLRDLDAGISAICGGMCSCATCHVYVDPEWVSKLRCPMKRTCCGIFRRAVTTHASPARSSSPLQSMAYA